MLKWLFVLAAITAVCIWNRDQIPEVIRQIRYTPVSLLILCSLLALGYFFCEGWIITLLASKYQSSFRSRDGIAGAFFCEFYRLLSLGSLTAAAEIYFLHTKKIPAAKGTGMCLVQYLTQRLTISILGFFSCALVFFWYPEVIESHTWQIVLSYILTLVVVAGLIFIGTCRRTTAHLFCFAERKMGNRIQFKNALFKAKIQVDILQEEVQDLLHERRKMIRLFFYNLLKMICWFLIPAILLFDPARPETLFSHMALTSMVFVLSGVIPAPGGIGSLEFVFILLFGEIINSETAASVILIFRLLISVVPFLLGALVVGASRQEGEKRAYPRF